MQEEIITTRKSHVFRSQKLQQIEEIYSNFASPVFGANPSLSLMLKKCILPISSIARNR